MIRRFLPLLLAAGCSTAPEPRAEPTHISYFVKASCPDPVATLIALKERTGVREFLLTDFRKDALAPDRERRLPIGAAEELKALVPEMLAQHGWVTLLADDRRVVLRKRMMDVWPRHARWPGTPPQKLPEPDVESFLRNVDALYAAVGCGEPIVHMDIRGGKVNRAAAIQYFRSVGIEDVELSHLDSQRRPVRGARVPLDQALNAENLHGFEANVGPTQLSYSGRPIDQILIVSPKLSEVSRLTRLADPVFWTWPR